MAEKNAKIIVIGNEKGGTGKSTVAMHLIVWYLRQNKFVASIDLDGRQGTLTHYIKNRATFEGAHHLNLGLPEHICASIGDNISPEEQEENETALMYQIEKMRKENDVIIIDTPGSDGKLFRTAHTLADILITPMNDSLVDLDLLAKIEPDTFNIKTPGHYAQTIWQARQRRAALRKPQMKWFVLRNRVMHVSNKNEKLVWNLLQALGKRINFTPISGLGERVIFRELFLHGLTLLDLSKQTKAVKLSAAHIAAKQELRNIIETIGF